MIISDEKRTDLFNEFESVRVHIPRKQYLALLTNVGCVIQNPMDITESMIDVTCLSLCRILVEDKEYLSSHSIDSLCFWFNKLADLVCGGRHLSTVDNKVMFDGVLNEMKFRNVEISELLKIS